MSAGGIKDAGFEFNEDFAMQVIEGKGEWHDVPGSDTEASVLLIGEPIKRGRWHDFLVRVAGNDSGARVDLGYFRVGGSMGSLYRAKYVAESFENVYNPRATRAEYESNLVFVHIQRLWRIDGTPRPPAMGAA